MSEPIPTSPAGGRRGGWGARAATWIVDRATRSPKAVVLVALVLLALLGDRARTLDVNADLAELLPHESPGFRALSHQMGRIGGGATLLLVVSSPNREANVAFVEDLGRRIDALAAARPDLVAYTEVGTKEVRAFYEANKWLYADLADLERADADLDRQIALRSGLVDDLEGNGSATPGGSAATTGPATAPTPTSSPNPIAPTPTEPARKDALGLGEALAKWDDRARSRDTFPTSYFEARNGTLFGIRIAANTALGGAGGDRLLAEVEALATEARRAHPGVVVGATGDIASAAGEKRALVSEAAFATALALALILAAIVLYFRSFAALVVIALPVALGVTAAYAFAREAFTHVNAAGAFLGAIIAGNGINYPIVLLGRYVEFRQRGMSAPVARREAVVNALRAELVGACVGAIAYGSLTLTGFRGFRQFGLIGFVGMLLVWASILPLVPATLVLLDRTVTRFPRTTALFSLDRASGRRSALAVLTTGALGFVARITTRRPGAIVAATLAVTVAALVAARGFIADPWEYDFGKLGSRSSDVSGAGEWSDKANEVFGGKANIAGASMVADTPDQVPLLEAQILANDARDPVGPMIAEVTTIDDALPGDRRAQDAKLAVLARIRERLTERVLFELGPEERATVLRAKPPADLRPLERRDLPSFVRRRFTERNGTVGTVFYVKPREDVVFADAHNHLRLSKTTDNVRLPDGTVVMTASRSTIFAEMLASLRHDGPLLSLVAFAAVSVVVACFAKRARVAAVVIASLVVAVVWLLGWAAVTGAHLNYVNFIALPITFAIGCEYPFNIADRTRLLDGDVAAAVERSAGAVVLCSFTTAVGYGSLLLSDFQALASFGSLAVVGELACIFGAIFFVPALLALLAPDARPMREGARSPRSGG